MRAFLRKLRKRRKWGEETLVMKWQEGKILALVPSVKRVSCNFKVEGDQSDCFVKVVEEDFPMNFRCLRSHLDLIEGFDLPNNRESFGLDSLDFVPRKVVCGLSSFVLPEDDRDKDFCKEIIAGECGKKDQ
ncbi:hypothetical protein QYF36_023408 [Acer negundo]|nr:hypothetical protein QYF36_023408 [Acer negundo]